MDSKSVGRSRTPRPTFRRRGDFSPVSTLAAGDFYERDARSNASQPAVPAFREVSRFARGGSLAADPPENTSTARPQGRDTRHAHRKIMALPHIGSRRVGRLAVKVRQLSVPSLTTEDRDETDEISARQPSDREACRGSKSLGVPMVRTPGGRQPDATQSDGRIARTISERDGGSEGRRRTSGRHQR